MKFTVEDVTICSISIVLLLFWRTKTKMYSALCCLFVIMNKVQIPGLVEKTVESMDAMLELIEYGNSVRTTHQTVSNDTSSRSHAICQVPSPIKLLLNKII